MMRAPLDPDLLPVIYGEVMDELEDEEMAFTQAGVKVIVKAALKPAHRIAVDYASNLEPGLRAYSSEGEYWSVDDMPYTITGRRIMDSLGEYVFQLDANGHIVRNMVFFHTYALLWYHETVVPRVLERSDIQYEPWMFPLGIIETVCHELAHVINAYENGVLSPHGVPIAPHGSLFAKAAQEVYNHPGFVNSDPIYWYALIAAGLQGDANYMAKVHRISSEREDESQKRTIYKLPEPKDFRKNPSELPDEKRELYEEYGFEFEPGDTVISSELK